MKRSHWQGLAAAALPLLVGYAYHVAAHLWGRPLAFQDDMRQHLLGLRPTADLFGAYFAATVPLGVAALHRLTSIFCDALDWARWAQPLLLGAWLAIASRRLAAALGREEDGWALAAWLQVFAWAGDDLVSSTPRAWALPFLIEILGSAAARQPVRLAGGVALAVLWYPPVAVLGWAVGAGMAAWLPVEAAFGEPELRGMPNAKAGSTSSRWRSGWRHELLRWFLALFLAGCALLIVARIYGHRLEPFGPGITRDEAIHADEFGDSGRAAFFSDNPISSWVMNSRGGLVNRDSEIPWVTVVAFGVMTFFKLPPALGRILPGLWSPRGRAAMTSWLAASAILFVSAHVLWHRLFHPSRYVQYSVTILAALLLAAVVSRWRWPFRAVAFAAVFALAVWMGRASYEDGRLAGTIQWEIGPPERAVLAAYPESELSATPPLLFGARSVASVELALPYHLGFYKLAAGRIRDALSVWYTDDPGKVLAFQQKYGVTHWILEGDAWKGRGHGFRVHQPWRGRVPRKMGEIAKPVLARIHEGRDHGRPVVVTAAQMTELLRHWPRPAPALPVPDVRIQR